MEERVEGCQEKDEGARRGMWVGEGEGGREGGRGGG